MSTVTSVTPSSNMTVATAPVSALASAIWTVFTPQTRASVFFTIGPQSSQVALSTLSTTVLSAARAVQGESTRARVAAVARCLSISYLLWFRDWSEEQGCEFRETERDDDKDGGGPKTDLG